MTRDEILLAAAQIFSQKGFHATSMQDIADAVSLQKASLYHHVSSKQEILVEVLDQALDLLISRMEMVMTAQLPPDQRLRLAMKSYLSTLLENRDLASVLLIEYRSLDPALNTRHIPRRDRYEHLWRILIQQGLDAGIFCCTDPSIAARALLGVLNSTISWYRPDGTYSPEEIACQYSDLFLTGLLHRPQEGARQ